MKTNNLIIILMIILVAGFLIYTNLTKEKTTISVSGQSTIEALADEASVYIGIDTLEKTAEDSKNKNAEISENVLNALKNINIDEKNIETSSYNIYPEYDYSNNRQELKGYRTLNVLKVKTQDFSKIGKIVDASIDAGANTIQSINFELSQEKQNQVKTEAISEASEDAHIKAQATAQGLNAKLGKVKSVTVQDYSYIPFPYYAAESGIAVKQALATEILPRNLEVNAVVNVVFELN
ncbi:MAG: SIMPL domain-containing protein [Nanoarchaeota archaeon]